MNYVLVLVFVFSGGGGIHSSPSATSQQIDLYSSFEEYKKAGESVLSQSKGGVRYYCVPRPREKQK